jgi:Protein of unknown function (DUF2569)
MPASPARFRSFTSQEDGVGGLLLLFAITQVAIVVITLLKWRVIIAAFDPSTSGTIGQMVPLYRPVAIAEAIVQALRIGLAVTGLILIWRRDRGTIVFYTGFLSFLIVWGIADHLAASRVFDGVLHMLDGTGRSTVALREVRDQSGMQTLQSIVYAIVWLCYWRTSARVRATFQQSPATAPLPTTVPTGPG